jgi:hypothetical protein
MKTSPARTLLQFIVFFFLSALVQQNSFGADFTNTTQSLPLPASVKIDFDRDIQPIFEEDCLRCHGPQKPRSNFRLDYRKGALAGGDDNTNDIFPGSSSNSMLIAYVARQVPDMEMPPLGKGTPLTPEQVTRLRAWIDQGANWSATNPPLSSASVIEPIIGGIGVHGDQDKFRELEGMKGGISAGVQNYSSTQQISADETLSMVGHLIAPEQDFGFQFALDKTDVGFIHTGVDQWRKYYAADGGFDPTVSPSGFNPNNDLYVDNGHAWIDLGLNLPRWPEIVLGYEYQYQTGNESTLDWGDANGKNIYPSTQSLDEQTHSLKFDITKSLDDWELEDHARVDFYLQNNRGAESEILFGGATPDEFINTQDKYRQVQGMNTATVEKQLQDWWFLNGGFYYSKLAGSDNFNQTTAIPSFGLNSTLSSQSITLDRESEIFSVANLFTPLNYLTLSLGTQNEWTQEKGFSESIPDLELGGTVPANSSLDEFKASQNANFRFTRIPFTIVSGDAQFSEDDYGIYQAEDTDELQRQTAAENFRYDLKTGFSTSPWRWGDLTVQYERQSSDTEYNQLEDLFLGVPGPTNGYPAFILDRTITSDQFEAKLALRPAMWLKIMLTYQIATTDYSSKTDPAYDPILAELVSEGGSISDGIYHLDTYGIGATVTPFRRFYFSGQFTYSQSRVTTADNGDPSIVPYRGDIFAFNGSATYLLSAKSSLQLSYNFSSADYSENNAAAGIPASLDYFRHDLIVGLTRKLTKNLSGSLRYEFSQYNEPSSGGAPNYHANGVFATLACRF